MGNLSNKCPRRLSLVLDIGTTCVMHVGLCGTYYVAKGTCLILKIGTWKGKRKAKTFFNKIADKSFPLQLHFCKVRVAQLLKQLVTFFAT